MQITDLKAKLTLEGGGVNSVLVKLMVVQNIFKINTNWCNSKIYKQSQIQTQMQIVSKCSKGKNTPEFYTGSELPYIQSRTNSLYGFPFK